MNVAVEIPDAVSGPLQSKWQDVPRRVLEATAAETYRTGMLTAHQVGQLLGHASRAGRRRRSSSASKPT